MQLPYHLNDFIFAEAAPGSPAVFDFEPSLFHLVRHLELQSPAGWLWYYALDEKHNRIPASLYLNVSNNDTASSVVRSPFGTIECSDDLPPEALYKFLQFVEAACKKRNLVSITLQDAPAAYAPRRSALLWTFLINLGYAATRAEVSACIKVGDKYEDGIHENEEQVLNKSRLAGLSYGTVPAEQLDRVYGFIAACHQLKGYALSMNYEDLRRTVSVFPERFILSCVFDNKQIVSASVAIRINKSILYNFYMDHDAGYNKLSPPLLLMEGMYRYCRDNGIELLDLGTSALGGQPNFGLLAFKLRAGAFPSPKLRFEKTLHS